VAITANASKEAQFLAGRSREIEKKTSLHGTALDKLPAFEKICEAAGGYGERVDDPAALPGALQRALAAVANEKRQALLNLICGPAAPRSGPASRQLGEQAAVAGRRLPHAERLTSAG
jgi:thiamine pyrophosphate-dependent acetolactate synthase large subunit-like protein